jgi:hypothetical protein
MRVHRTDGSESRAEKLHAGCAAKRQACVDHFRRVGIAVGTACTLGKAHHEGLIFNVDVDPKWDNSLCEERCGRGCNEVGLCQAWFVQGKGSYVEGLVIVRQSHGYVYIPPLLLIAAA